MTATGGVSSVDVSNVLSEEKKQQIIALGRLGCCQSRSQVVSACTKLEPEPIIPALPDFLHPSDLDAGHRARGDQRYDESREAEICAARSTY